MYRLSHDDFESFCPALRYAKPARLNVADNFVKTPTGINPVARRAAFADEMCGCAGVQSGGNGLFVYGGELLLLVQWQEFLTVDGHVARCFDSQADLAAVDVYDRNADIFADVNLLSELATENQHCATLLLCVLC